MSTPKWTPGPWLMAGEVKLVGSKESCDLLYCGDVRPAVPVGSYRGEICHIQSADHICQGIRIEEARANAHIIAAAPELYEALVASNRTLLAIYHSLKNYEPGIDILMQENEAILAKARGEATS